MADRTVRVRVVAELPGVAAAMNGGAANIARVGEAAAVAGRSVRALGVDGEAARAGMMAMGAGARGGAAGLTEAEAAALAAQRGTRAMRDETAAVSPAIRRMESEARGGFAGIRSGVESALEPVKHLGTLLAGGAILYGIHDIVHQGNEYSDSMLKFSEVTRASGVQMQAAGKEAQALGADMKLPSSNAAEAADAMVELAKAGLSAGDAVKAARGTIQLSAAARTDVATAAKIEGDIMDQFALKASDATKVADTLANTANSSSGELMDLYYAMKYVGPTAHSMGISIQDAATAVGLLGKSGIIGETAGTSLRGALVNMARPTKQAQEGLHALGIEAFDSQGRFKGLQYVITQLHDAQEHLTTQQFTAAAAMAFGKPALSAMTALAERGGEAFQTFSAQVGRVGGAAALASAESKGLGGAMRGLGKELQSVFLQLYLGIAPGLEKVTRSMTGAVSSAIPYIKDGIRVAMDLWDIYGPGVEGKLKAAESGIVREAVSFADPMKAALAGVAASAVPLAVTGIHSVEVAFGNATAAANPLLGGLHAVFSSVTSGAGALGILTGRLQVGIGLLGDMTGVLRPIGELVGGLGHAFAALPGPIQLSVLAMLAMRPFRGQIQGMQQAVVDFGRNGINAFRGIGDAALYQRVLAAQAGVTLTQFGGVIEELSRRSPTFAAMAGSFRSVSGSIQDAGGRLVGFRAAAGGAAAALGTGVGRGLLGAARGLWAFLGGPWGIAIGAAMVGLDMLAKKQQEAAAAAAAHQQRIGSLAQALQESNGIMTGSVRATAVQTLADTKLKDGKTQLLDVMKTAGVSALTLTNAYLGQGTSIDALRKKLMAAASENQRWITNGRTTQQVYTPQGEIYKRAADALGSLSGEYPDAIQRQKDLAAAIKGGSDASTDATNPTKRLKDLINTLGSAESDASTKADALHNALQLLSGGELDVEAATATMNSAMLDLNGSWKDGVDHSQGYGRALLQVDGSLNTTSQNGQTLWNKLQALNTGAASAASATYDFARANGDGVVPALQKAERPMQTAWSAAVKAGEAFGLSAGQAEELASQMQFIPSNLAISLAVNDLTPTEQALLYVQGLTDHLPKGATVTVAALTDDAVRALESVGIKVKKLPGGRQMEITAPTGKALAALDALIAKQLPGKDVPVTALTGQALSDLENVQTKVAATHGKTVTMGALTKDAQDALTSLGFKISNTHGKTVTITLPTGGPVSAAQTIQNYIDGVHGKDVTVRIMTDYFTAGSPSDLAAAHGRATGGLVRRYADGGHAAVQYIPFGGPVSGPGTGTSDSIPALISNGEYVIKKAAVDRYGVAMFDRLNAMRYAAGGLAGFTYSPTATPVLGGPTDPMSRYNYDLKTLTDDWSNLNKALADARKKADALRSAEENLSYVRRHHHTAAQLRAAEDKVNKAEAAKRAADSTVATDRGHVNAADRNMGLRPGSKAPTGFDLNAYQKQLNDSLAATNKWRGDLAKISKRGGADVEAMLESMGQDGAELVNKLAGASNKQFNDIIKKLKETGDTAKVTLADYQKQLGGATQQSKQFAADLQKLAAEGFGDLAQQLASQGDANAMTLAHEAAGNSKSAASANKTVQQAQNTLTGSDLTNSLTLLSTLRSGPGKGYADLIAAGLTTDVIKALVPKMTSQIKALPDANKATFVRQWIGQGGQPMARGGILTSATPVIAGEAGPEAFIPLNGSIRGRSLLATAAAAYGLQLVPARTYAAPVAHAPDCKGHGDHVNNVTINAASQSFAEQKADLMRHLVALS
ncbi:phage tail tape measure protein [Streptomyces sp. NPDC048665]|uniref:phage tail tape measure protein n=1 Tax=Streptomyces sp. NPDC048665 TaxID=3155490 RepID=UPI0034155F19